MTLFHVLILLILLFLIIPIYNIIVDWNWYVIKKGSHYTRSIKRIAFLKFGNRLRFKAKFDNSCFYDTEIVNGEDVNKLYGFILPGSTVHKNSVRFGWRPNLQGQIEIFCYFYLDGKRTIEQLGTAELNKVYDFRLEVRDHCYIFEFDKASRAYITLRNKKRGMGFKLYPYFGGNNTAPHDIRICIV